MATRDEVLTALAEIPGPDGRTPLPESGAISGISMREAKVFAAIAIDPAQAEAMEPMRARAEAAIKALPGVESAVVTLTAESARTVGAAAARHGAGHDHAHGGAARSTSPLPGVAQIIAVASGKGGVGKSTVACNLAVGLAKLGLRVGLLDADLYGPSAPKLFGIADRPEIGEDGHKLDPPRQFGREGDVDRLSRRRGRADHLARTDGDVRAHAVAARGRMGARSTYFSSTCPPGTGDTQLTMAQSVPLAGAVIVSTPQDLALIDARRGIAMFNQVHVPLLGIVENMSYFLCPHCGGRTDIFSHAGARKEAEQLGVPFLGEVPLDATIRENSDGGRPIVASMPDSAQAEAFMHIARGVAQSLSTGAGAAKPAPRIRIA